MIYLSQRAQRRKAGLMIDFGLFSAAAFAENNGQPADIYEFAENKLAREPCLCVFARDLDIGQPCSPREILVWPA